MEKMVKMETEEGYSYFMRVLFGMVGPTPLNMEKVGDIEWVDPTLNESQKDAIKFALASERLR